MLKIQLCNDFIIIIENRDFNFFNCCIFDQINATLDIIRHFFQKH